MCFKSRKVVKYELQGIQKNQELSPTHPTNSKSRVWLAATSVSWWLYLQIRLSWQMQNIGASGRYVATIDMMPQWIQYSYFEFNWTENETDKVIKLLINMYFKHFQHDRYLEPLTKNDRNSRQSHFPTLTNACKKLQWDQQVWPDQRDVQEWQAARFCLKDVDVFEPKRENNWRRKRSKSLRNSASGVD